MTITAAGVAYVLDILNRCKFSFPSITRSALRKKKIKKKKMHDLEWLSIIELLGNYLACRMKSGYFQRVLCIADIFHRPRIKSVLILDHTGFSLTIGCEFLTTRVCTEFVPQGNLINGQSQRLKNKPREWVIRFLWVRRDIVLPPNHLSYACRSMCLGGGCFS